MSDKIKKYFSLSNWAIDNSLTVWVIIFALLAAGVVTYVNMPREDFPEVVESTTYVSTAYPGNSAEDIEKLVTKPLEEEIKNITGVGDITSESLQDYSIITVEWDDDDIGPEEAKQLVKDKVDLVTAEGDWPTMDTGAPVDPQAFSLNISESVPIININLTGKTYTRQQLKDYAEYLQEKFEDLSEVKEVDILGVDDREVEVALDLYKMNASNVSMNDVINAIQSENTTISGGNVIQNGLRRNIRIIGEIEEPKELLNIVVKNQDGLVYMSDIAEVNLQEVDKTTYARNYGEPVVMLSVKKKSGKNLLDATDKINEIVDKEVENYFPDNLNVEVTGDTSSQIRNQISELENSIIFGVILVIGVLMFFLGFRNAIFVGIAIPMSMLLSFVLLPRVGPMITGTNISLNTMTLFALIMGLGMLVDNGIVVVENVYRKLDEGLSKKEAAKQGVGEIAWPIIASTATTLAAFFPLGLWPGTIGKFMIYFPVTLSMVLFASLFVALVINSMLTSQFMSVEEPKITQKTLYITSFSFLVLGLFLILVAQLDQPMLLTILGLVALVGGLVLTIWGWLNRNKTNFLRIGMYAIGGALFFLLFSLLKQPQAYQGFGTLFILIAILQWLFKYAINPAAEHFQRKTLPALENMYQGFLRFALRGRFTPYAFVGGTFLLLIIAIGLFSVTKFNVLFFPDNIPNQAIVYIEYPEGTDIEKTNDLTELVEKRVFEVVDDYKVYEDDKKYGELAEENVNGYNRLVESVISQVGQGAGNPNTDGANQNEMPNKGKVTVQFREFRYRDGTNTTKVLTDIREAVQGIPGAVITVEKDQNGPPQGAPVNLELIGDDYDRLIEVAKNVRTHITEETGIAGIEELKLDVNTNKPELEIYVDRVKAGNLGVSTAMVGQALRQSVYGWEVSTYKPANDDDDYKIMARLNDETRYDLNALLNQKLSFRNNNGQLMTVPISSVATTKKLSSFSKIKRKNLDRVITLYSNVLEGYNANSIVEQIDSELQNYDLPEGIRYKFTGEQEEQAENMAFLSQALLIGLAVILLIIVGQFNSISKPVIIFLAIFLSFIGVLFGMIILKLEFVILMTMLGIIALAGIVVNNAIVLIDYTQLMIDRKKDELGVDLDDLLTREQFRDAIVKGGTARLRPVLLTAITTILGLLPLTFGLNINFFTLFTKFDPQIFIGGDNTLFWKPMTLVIINGLTFATFLTLVIVPVLFYIRLRGKIRMAENEDDTD